MLSAEQTKHKSCAYSIDSCYKTVEYNMVLKTIQLWEGYNCVQAMDSPYIVPLMGKL